MYKRIQVSRKILNEQRSSPYGACSQNLLNNNFNVIRSCFEFAEIWSKEKTTGVLRIIIIIIVLSLR